MKCKVITLLLLLETDKSYAQNPTYAKSVNRRQRWFISKRYGPTFIDRSIFPYRTKKLLSVLISKIVFKKFYSAKMRPPFQIQYTHRAGTPGINATIASITSVFIHCYLQNFLLPGRLCHFATQLKKEHRTMLFDRQQTFASFEFPESLCLLNPVGRSAFARITQQDGQQSYDSQQYRIIEIAHDLQRRHARQSRSHQQLSPVGQQTLRETRKRVEQARTPPPTHPEPVGNRPRNRQAKGRTCRQRCRKRKFWRRRRKRQRGTPSRTC